jgi:hypothetical protein
MSTEANGASVKVPILAVFTNSVAEDKISFEANKGANTL